MYFLLWIAVKTIAALRFELRALFARQVLYYLSQTLSPQPFLF
jgi:hypothetical protein